MVAPHRTEHAVRNALLVAAVAGAAKLVRRDRPTLGRSYEPPRIGESPLGEPGEVLWYC